MTTQDEQEATQINFSSIRVGDRVQIYTGEWVKVETVGRGFYARSTLITWDGDKHWACHPNASKIMVKANTIRD